MKHLINWVEIPVADIGRATTFYSAIFKALKFCQMEMNGLQYALFPTEDTYNSGALVEGADYKPAASGILIYLDGGKDLNEILHRVDAAGGQVLMEKTFLGEGAGYVGMFKDIDGNRIGLQHQ